MILKFNSIQSFSRKTKMTEKKNAVKKLSWITVTVFHCTNVNNKYGWRRSSENRFRKQVNFLLKYVLFSFFLFFFWKKKKNLCYCLFRNFIAFHSILVAVFGCQFMPANQVKFKFEMIPLSKQLSVPIFYVTYKRQKSIYVF